MFCCIVILTSNQMGNYRKCKIPLSHLTVLSVKRNVALIKSTFFNSVHNRCAISPKLIKNFDPIQIQIEATFEIFKLDCALQLFSTGFPAFINETPSPS